MDQVLSLADHYFLDDLYAHFLPLPLAPLTSGLEFLNSTTFPGPYSASTTYGLSSTILKATSSLPRDSIIRQLNSLFWIAWIGSAALYFFFSGLSYYLFFDKRLKYHPRFIPGQEWLEIKSSMIAMPTIDIMTLPWFIAEVRGKSLLYTDVKEYGWVWLGVSTVLYMVFNDVAIYWIHRLEHHKSIYKYIHKPHHRWVIATPWAALAFHPLDGYAQSLPYHLFVFLVPMQKTLYLTLFVLVQLWTVFIHDSDMLSGSWWEHYINSPAHHTIHHLTFNSNFGQYFVWADKKWASHRDPAPHLDPIHEALRVMRERGLIDADGNEIPQIQSRKEKDL